MHKQYLLGISCKSLSLICFCALSLLVENAQSRLSSIEQFGVVCLIGTLLLLPIVLIKFREALKNAKFKLYPLRAFISIGGMLCWMEAVKHIGSSEAILVNYATPVFAIFLASLMKEEKIHRICLLAGCFSFVIIGIILKPKIEFALYGIGMAFVSTILWASYEVVCKKQTHHEHFLIQGFYTFVLAALLLAPFSLGRLVDLHPNDWLMLSYMALLRIANVVLLFLALKWATLNWAAPVSYLKFPIMAAIGFLCLDKQNSFSYWIAATCLILVNITVMTIRRRSLVKIQQAEPKACLA